MQKWDKKRIGLLGIVAVLTFFAWLVDKSEVIVTEGGQLIRAEHGQGEYEAELLLEVDGKQAEKFSVLVPEKRLTQEEEEAYLLAAIAEIEEGFQGKNHSLEEISGAVHLQTSYQQEQVLAEWEFSNSRLINETGVIEEAYLQGEEEIVEAVVLLTCEDSSRFYTFYFTVCKKEKSEEEQFYEKLNQFISKSREAEGTEVLCLPTELEGHTLVWKEQKSYLPLQIFAVGIVIVLLVPVVEAEREKEAKEKRAAQLLREYPEMINKLTLLLGAGMTLQGAWKKIVSGYLEIQKKTGAEKKLVYEEMLITQREIDGGKGEIISYKAFGERCGIAKYRKFSNYLIQNRKKGSQGLCQLLEKEAEDAFIQRKNMAQQCSEEAGTKLLFPMLLMLGIVIFVIMIPAILSFQTGIN